MKLGVLAYSTKTGLGYQTKSYVKWLKPKKIMEVDLSGLNGSMQNDWYKDSIKVKGYPRDRDIIKFLAGLDVVLLAETPLNYALYTHARNMGVKTAVVLNWEFFDHIIHPEYSLPDMFIMPSLWGYEEAKTFADEHNIACIQLHHPVDREEFPFRLRTTKKMFHIAGKPAANDRNGTWDFMLYCPTGVVVTQSHDLAFNIRRKYRHCNVFTDIKEPLQMYQKGDIMVLPRRYGGNCLPLNEALSCGIPVCMPDIVPNNNILPKEWLFKAKVVDKFTPRTEVDLYSPISLSFTDRLRWFEQCDIEAESKKADAIAETISWSVMKNRYLNALKSLL